MSKRQPANTVTAAITSMANAQIKISPPSHVKVPAEALPFWQSITEARAVDRWTDTDLENAAELARTKASIERLNIELQAEGDVIVNQRGTPIVNPKHGLLETLTRRMVALSRMLQIHAHATQGESRDQVKANQSAAKSRQTINEIDVDDLIARPH